MFWCSSWAEGPEAGCSIWFSTTPKLRRGKRWPPMIWQLQQHLVALTLLQWACTPSPCGFELLSSLWWWARLVCCGRGGVILLSCGRFVQSMAVQPPGLEWSPRVCCSAETGPSNSGRQSVKESSYLKACSLLYFTHQFTMGYCYKNESEWEWKYLKIACFWRTLLEAS